MAEQTRKQTPPPRAGRDRPGTPARRRGRGPLIAGLVVAVILFAVLRSRRRQSESVGDTIPLGSMYGGAVDTGAAGGSLGYADLTDYRLAGIETLLGSLDERLDTLETIPGTIPGPGAPTDPNAVPGEAPIGTPAAPTEQGASGQAPATVPSATRVSLATVLASMPNATGRGPGKTGRSGPGPAGQTPAGQIGRAKSGTKATPARRAQPPLAPLPPSQPRQPAKPKTGQLPGKPTSGPQTPPRTIPVVLPPAKKKGTRK